MPPHAIIRSSAFTKQVKRLKKHFPNIEKDLAKAEMAIQVQPRGQTRYPGFGSLEVYKLRLKCSDIPHGKSKGYRVVYLYQSEIVKIKLLAIYHKSEQADIDIKTVKKIIEEFEV
jgi:mRNA-degrading endonuclease RelE of RelBE toxin-antitoxin system